MTHRETKHLLSFLLCLSVLFLGSTVYYGAKAGRYAQYADYSGQRAAAQLIGSLESMKTVMDALPYTADTNLFPQTAALLSREASAAAAALSALSLEDAHLERTGTYINQAGDLAHALLVQHLAGLPLEEAQRDQLEALCGHMEGLLEGMRDVKLRLNAGALSLGDFGAGDPELAEAMGALEQTVPEEGLRYDGAYGVRDTAEAAGLKEQVMISLEEAAELIKALAGRELPLQCELTAPIPAWCFGDQALSVTVTQAGGKLLRWLQDEPEGQPILRAEEAEQAAARFLEQAGYGGLTVSDRRLDGDWCLLTYTPTENGVALLPDAVRVTVSLVNGDILGLEAQDYLLYHAARQLDAPMLSAQEAQSRLPEGLAAEGGHMALAHSAGGREVLCYSFTCRTPEGDALRILVRADNGALWDLEPQPDLGLD